MEGKIFQVVREQLGKDELTREDILAVTKLELNKMELTDEDIKVLAEFHNLEWLSLADNLLTDLSPIAELTNLKELYCMNDPFLPEEEKAKLKGKNRFTDFSFLRNLTNLTHLNVTYTDIDNIEFVRMLPNLTHFWAYSNPIHDRKICRRWKTIPSLPTLMRTSPEFATLLPSGR